MLQSFQTPQMLLFQNMPIKVVAYCSEKMLHRRMAFTIIVCYSFIYLFSQFKVSCKIFYIFEPTSFDA